MIIRAIATGVLVAFASLFITGTVFAYEKSVAKAVQSKIGVIADEIFGPGSIKAAEAWRKTNPEADLPAITNDNLEETLPEWFVYFNKKAAEAYNGTFNGDWKSTKYKKSTGKVKLVCRDAGKVYMSCTAHIQKSKNYTQIQPLGVEWDMSRSAPKIDNGGFQYDFDFDEQGRLIIRYKIPKDKGVWTLERQD